MKLSRDITFREMIKKLVMLEQKAQEDIVHFPKYQLPEEVDEGQETEKEPAGVEASSNGSTTGTSTSRVKRSERS